MNKFERQRENKKPPGFPRPCFLVAERKISFRKHLAAKGTNSLNHKNAAKQNQSSDVEQEV